VDFYNKNRMENILLQNMKLKIFIVIQTSKNLKNDNDKKNCKNIIFFLNFVFNKTILFLKNVHNFFNNKCFFIYESPNYFYK